MLSCDIKRKKNTGCTWGSFYKYLRKNGNLSDLWSRADPTFLSCEGGQIYARECIEHRLSSWSELIPFRRPRWGRTRREIPWTFQHFYVRCELGRDWKERRGNATRITSVRESYCGSKWRKRRNNRRGNIREGSKGGKAERVDSASALTAFNGNSTPLLKTNGAANVWSAAML